MKKILSISMLACAVSAFAQDAYMNEQTLNSSEDVIGTSRYVGMGGAMGALGADISVIGWNPAGIGLFRKGDASLTFGGLWNKNGINERSRGTGSFDQIGVVFNIKTESDVCPYVNLAINYQKKKNFYSNFYADNLQLGGISQIDQLTELANLYSSMNFDMNNLYNLTGHLAYNGVIPYSDTEGKYYNQNRNDYNNYTHHSSGSLHGWDFNVSTNVQDRAYFGFTFGVDNLNYTAYTEYLEGYYNSNNRPVDDYRINNDYDISGYGFNFKVGGIVRPFENNPFRVGFAIESPTWYKLKSRVWLNCTNIIDNVSSKPEDVGVDYNPTTPWKFRASMGSTVGNKFAWDVDYEYANYKGMTQRYPDYYDSFGGTKDVAMNDFTNMTLRGVHTLRAGMEIRPIAPLTFRLGYNYITAAYDQNAQFDQYELLLSESPSVLGMTSTNYMIKKPTHILALGMGYRWRRCYVDLAYKIRHQKADFYAFDDSFTGPDTDFSNDNPTLAGVRLAAVSLDLTRHYITCTLGFKF